MIIINKVVPVNMLKIVAEKVGLIVGKYFKYRTCNIKTEIGSPTVILSNHDSISFSIDIINTALILN